MKLKVILDRKNIKVVKDEYNTIGEEEVVLSAEEFEEQYTVQNLIKAGKTLTVEEIKCIENGATISAHFYLLPFKNRTY